MMDDLENYKNLARAVILQALLDISTVPKQRDKLISLKAWAKKWREKWCALAEIDEEKLRSVALRLLDREKGKDKKLKEFDKNSRKSAKRILGKV